MDNLRTKSLDHDEVVVFFGITSLYTVFVKEAIFEAAEKLYSGRFTMPSEDKETSIIFAVSLTTNVLMLTHDGIYHQIDGLAMGSQPHHHQTFCHQNLNPTFEMMLNVLKDTWATFLGPLKTVYSD